MISIKKFFKPSWKKLMWLLILFFVAQLYFNLIYGYIPSIIANFVGLILNPATIMLGSLLTGIEGNLSSAIAETINLIWLYCLAIIFAKEISHDEE